jgi:hypothetical protein
LPTCCRLALENGGLRLCSRSAGIESGDISPHATLLPVLEQAACHRAPAWDREDYGVRRDVAALASPRSGENAQGPVQHGAPSQDVGKGEPRGRGKRWGIVHPRHSQGAVSRGPGPSGAEGFQGSRDGLASGSFLLFRLRLGQRPPFPGRGRHGDLPLQDIPFFRPAQWCLGGSELDDR